MILIRSPSETLELLKGHKSNLRDEVGEVREPERCRTCQQVLTPHLREGRIVSLCTDCPKD